MESLVVLILIAWAILFFIIFPVWAIIAVRRSERKADEAASRLEELESTVAHLKRRVTSTVSPQTPHVEAPRAEEAKQPREPVPQAPEVVESAPAAPTPPRRTPPPFVPPLPRDEATSPPPPAPPEPLAAAQAPPPPSKPSATPPPASPINWERFMGVNMLAWVGGFVLFLAAAFFVKYSIDNNLISPQIRVSIGFLLGAGLLVAGLLLSARNLKVTAHTLCGTGIVILYADIFAAHSFYSFISQPVAFLLMILTTAAAILLAIRLEAKAVAILGLLGGFLTPPLLSTGEDHPLGLFSYIAFLDAGLILVGLKRRWAFLVVLAAAGTVFMQIGWAAKFFEVSKVFISMGVFFAFQALFLAAFLAAFRQEQDSGSYVAAAILMPFTTLGFLLYLLSFKELGAQPLTVFLFALVSDLCLMALVIQRPSLHVAHRLAGLFIFFLLASWTFVYLVPELLYRALGLYLAFAILHAAFPLVLLKLRPETNPAAWDQLFAPLALVLAMIPVFRLTEISLGFWFVILLIDMLAMWIAIATASLVSIIAALFLTVVSLVAWMLRMPGGTLQGLPELLSVTAAFSLIFFGVGIFAAKRAKAAKIDVSADTLAQLPAMAGILPFLLLILTVLHLPLDNPTPVFGLALLLTILLLGLSRMLKIGFLSFIALLCVVTLEYSWHSVRFKPDFAVVPLAWYLLFYAVFAAYPFVFRQGMEEQLSPWVTSALSAPLHFYLLYRLVSAAYPNSFMGLLPAVFSIPSFAGLIQRIRALPRDNAGRNAQLAWFGGVTLFFITLIFPVQFERRWILIGWALEGAALLWLLQRVPHPGLKVVGAALLTVAFFGLVNPGFFMEHPRSSMRLVNWYLYTYGLVTVSLMVGAKLMNPPQNRIGPVNVQPALYAMGTLLAFLLMNIEIADYYSDGPVLAFQFSGSFARDMTYSIAWAGFAFVMLIVGIRKNIPAARYASMALLGITLLKVFFHDLAALKQLYRVGALVGVAVVLILASYLYQRYVTFEPAAGKEE